MSIAAPSYYDNEDFLKWFDFEKNEFREGAPQQLIDMVRAEDAARAREAEKTHDDGFWL